MKSKSLISVDKVLVVIFTPGSEIGALVVILSPAPVNTDLNECKSRQNACSVNSQCIDEQILYRCACNDNYEDITSEVIDTGKLWVWIFDDLLIKLLESGYDGERTARSDLRL